MVVMVVMVAIFPTRREKCQRQKIYMGRSIPTIATITTTRTLDCVSTGRLVQTCAQLWPPPFLGSFHAHLHTARNDRMNSLVLSTT